MKKYLIILAIMLLPGAVFAQTPTQTPLTKEQLEIALKNVTVEKEYLQAKVRLIELLLQEQNLTQALENIKKGKEAPKAEPKKEPKK